MKKTLFIGDIWCSIFIAFVSCNSQGQINQGEKKLQQQAQTQTALDAQAHVIYRDSQDNIWLVSDEKGVYKYDGARLTIYTSEDGLLSYRILNVQEDHMRNLYFDTPDGVYKYSGDTFSVLPISDAEAVQTWQSKPEDLWFRMGWDKRGPYRFDGKKLYHIPFPKNKMEDEFYKNNPNASINPYAIYSMYKDSKGNVWFGTSNVGIYMYNGTEISWMHENHLLETPSGGNFGIRSIGEDMEGNYWICNARYKYSLLPHKKEGDGLQSINYKRHVGIENIVDEHLYFYAIETDANGDILMFAQEDGLWRNNGKELTPMFITDGAQSISPTSMYKDRAGTFWFDTAQSGIYKYNGKTFEKFTLE